MMAQVVVASANTLGESVFWSEATQQVYWVDGVAPAIHRWHPATRAHSVVQLAVAPLGMIVETTDARCVALTDRDGISLFHLDTGRKQLLASPEKRRDGVGYNDAKVDREGRLWVGTYDVAELEPRGCLWLLENDNVPSLAEAGMTVVNGPAFSPDGRLLYLSDSIAKRILAFDLASGSLSNRRVLAQFAPEEGLPDGLTVDAEGCIWCAHWDGGRVTRFAPTGERLAVITVPAPRVTSVAFGGADLDILFITTARYGLSDQELAAAPQAGALFSAKPGVKGVAATLLTLPFICQERA